MVVYVTERMSPTLTVTLVALAKMPAPVSKKKVVFTPEPAPAFAYRLSHKF